MSARCPCDRAGLPDGADECGLCQLDDANGVRPAPRAQDQATFRPPADQRCTRCDRILLSAPCGCETRVEVYLRLAAETAAAFAALTPAERIEAVREKAARRRAA